MMEGSVPPRLWHPTDHSNSLDRGTPNSAHNDGDFLMEEGRAGPPGRPPSRSIQVAHKEDAVMAFRDLRDYIAALEQHGEAIRIKDQVDWDLEAGAIVRLAQQLQAPAPIMENITDYPGQGLAGALYATYRRGAIAIGEKPN